MKSVQVEIINNLIKREKVDTNSISDGYHTFGELYDHRITLFICLARLKAQTTSIIPVWRCQTDKDWFILGIDVVPGKQITYHLPMSRWEETEFAMTLDLKNKPEWDGHTSQDILNRLKQL